MKKHYINPTITVMGVESENILAGSSMSISDKTTSTSDEGPITSGDARENNFSLWDE